MYIQEQELLAPYTTLKIGGPARYFARVKTAEEVEEGVRFAREKKLPVFVLGGGSNVVVNDAGYDGVVLLIENEGIEVQRGDGDTVMLKVAAGEVWDKVVAQAVENGWWGIENLSHIPGKSGAIAVQNVGAYGQEASQVVESVEVFDMSDNTVKNLAKAECGFSYRSSIFNGVEKGRYVILSLVFKLKKQGEPNLSYKDVKEYFAGKTPTLAEVRQAIVAIRNKKFPFPTEAKNGNVGSFFKNPVLPLTEFDSAYETVRTALGVEAAETLKQKRILQDGALKIPAAFLIDICGLKGTQLDGAAINYTQPLVILNQTGTATAKDVLALADLIKKTVFKKTGIMLTQEPELVGF